MQWLQDTDEFPSDITEHRAGQSALYSIRHT